MATLVRLTQEQIDHLFDEAFELEREFKDMHEQLVSLDLPMEAISRFSKLHDRFTASIDYLRRQRELGEPPPEN
jgi:hypothetical protein